MTDRSAGESAGERIARAMLELRTDDLPAAVLLAGIERILDTVGVAVAAIGDPAADSVAAAALATDNGGDVPVWGRGTSASARTAALVNGTAAHALDFDDSLFSSIMHAGAVVVPTALAVAAQHPVSGHDLLAAIACGYQVADLLGRQTPGVFQAHGFQPSAVLGVFAGVVTAARLRGLDTTTALHAIGLAGSMSSGLMEFLDAGGHGKPLQVGWAAQSALFAVDLALAGAEGPATVLEGRYGIFRSFARSELPADLDVWSDHAILRVATKPYPVCHGIHDPADLWRDTIAELRARGIDPVSDVAELTCVVSAFTVRLTLDPIEVKRRPATPHQARFSLPYCLARIALDGTLGNDAFTPEAIRDPYAARFADHVTYEVDEDGVLPGTTRTRLRLRTADGTVVERELHRNRDARTGLFGPDDLRAKFTRNLVGRTGPAAAERGLAAAAALYDSDDTAPILAWLASDAAGPGVDAHRSVSS